jgi:hypothetical protein
MVQSDTVLQRDLLSKYIFFINNVVLLGFQPFAKTYQTKMKRITHHNKTEWAVQQTLGTSH